MTRVLHSSHFIRSAVLWAGLLGAVLPAVPVWGTEPVRTGVLEGMAREGKLDIKRIKVLNRQDLPDFPALVSTRFYPG